MRPPTGQKREHPGHADTHPRRRRGRPSTTGTRTQQGPLAGKQSEEKKREGAGPTGQRPEQATVTTCVPQHERTQSHTHRPPPPPQLAKGPHREGREPTPTTPATAKKKRGGGQHPQQPPTAAGNITRERQGRTTTEVKEVPPHQTGPAAGTGEGPPAPQKTATDPSQGNASRQAGVRGNPTRTTRLQPDQERRGTKETGTHPHHPRTQPRRGRLRTNPYLGTNCNPQPRKAGRKRRPYLHTHHQPRSGHPNTRAPNPNQNRRKTCATHTHPHKSQPAARNERRQATTQTRAPTEPKNPNQEKPGEDQPLTQARAPHNSRKPSVHSSDTKAARAMQVTRPNEVRRPGVRLHFQACAALGLERSMQQPSTSGPKYQERAAGMPWERDMPGSPMNP